MWLREWHHIYATSRWLCYEPTILGSLRAMYSQQLPCESHVHTNGTTKEQLRSLCWRQHGNSPRKKIVSYPRIGPFSVLTHCLAFWCYHWFQAFSKLTIRVRHYEMESILIGPIFAKSIFYFYWFVVLAYIWSYLYANFPVKGVAGKCYNIYRVYVILFLSESMRSFRWTIVTKLLASRWS